jgi:hypothetical protein
MTLVTQTPELEARLLRMKLRLGILRFVANNAWRFTTQIVQYFSRIAPKEMILEELEKLVDEGQVVRYPGVRGASQIWLAEFSMYKQAQIDVAQEHQFSREEMRKLNRVDETLAVEEGA